MQYVSVNIIAPEGQHYQAEVDRDGTVSEVLHDLVIMLALPIKTINDEPIEYRLLLVDAFRLEQGSTLKIEQVRSESSVRILRRL